jgi:hypothetical protein
MTDTAVYRNALPAGTLLMEYRLDGVLGAGGFGLTYLAWDTNLQKQVAIKEYLPTETALRALDGSVVPIATQRHEDYRWGLERFLQEARTLARFTHPHIVRVNRYFEANGTAYMVMEYERGESLSALLKREPCPSEERLREILLPVLSGLRAVHEAGFLHRDIKPGNIFLREQGGPVLLDFGAARHAPGGSTDHTAVVTPGYAPIEQYSAGGPQGPWSDIYAVAAVFFRAVTNANPPDAVGRLRCDSVGVALSAQRGRYTGSLLSAIGWGLEPEEQRRPRSVAQWQAGLTGLEAVPYRLPEPSPPEGCDAATLVSRPDAARSPRFRRRSMAHHLWAAPAIAGLAALSLIVARGHERDGPRDVPSVPAAAAPVTLETAPPQEVTPRVVAPAAGSSKTTQAAQGARREHKAVARAAPRARDGAASSDVPARGARAPVRDAVALPPLAGLARERPERERSARPGIDP